MKTKTSKQPKPTVQLGDIKPKKDAKGGYNPKELGFDKSVPWQKSGKVS